MSKAIDGPGCGHGGFETGRKKGAGDKFGSILKSSGEGGVGAREDARQLLKAGPGDSGAQQLRLGDGGAQMMGHAGLRGGDGQSEGGPRGFAGFGADKFTSDASASAAQGRGPNRGEGGGGFTGMKSLAAAMLGGDGRAETSGQSENAGAGRGGTGANAGMAALAQAKADTGAASRDSPAAGEAKAPPSTPPLNAQGQGADPQRGAGLPSNSPGAPSAPAQESRIPVEPRLLFAQHGVELTHLEIGLGAAAPFETPREDLPLIPFLAAGLVPLRARRKRPVRTRPRGVMRLEPNGLNATRLEFDGAGGALLLGEGVRIAYQGVEIFPDGVIIALDGAGRWSGEEAVIRLDTDGRALLAEPMGAADIYLLRSCVNDIEFEIDARIIRV